MKTLFFIIFLLPLTVLSQVGIKAGLTTPKGYHAGLVFAKPLSDSASGYFQLEALYNNRQDKEAVAFTNERGDFSHYEYIKIQNSYFMLPITLKSEYAFGSFIPYFQLGAAPTFGFSKKATSFDLGALFGLGIRVNKFTVDGRFVFNTKGLKTETNNKNFMISLGYFLK